jgi:DNA-binding response OmpR family regulator
MIAKRVLIVDHYDPTLDLLVEVLKSEGYTALRYSGECLSAAYIAEARADLLILDLEISDPDGALLLLRALRHQPNTWALPVIVNSTDDRLLGRLAEELRELNCTALSKPFDLGMLVSVVSASLDTGRERSRGSSAEHAY